MASAGYSSPGGTGNTTGARVLLSLVHAQCLRMDRGPQTAADMATDTSNKLPTSYRTGWCRHAEALCDALTHRPRAQLTEALST